MKAYRGDCDEVIEQAQKAGVSKIMTIGIDLQSSVKALELAKKYPMVHCSIGIHPHNVEGVSEDHYRKLSALADNIEVKAYGEIGLDFFKDYAPHDLQIYHFARQLELSKELDLPVIIHDRDAHEQVMKHLHACKSFPAGGVMHCYSGDANLAKEIIDLGFYISIPGVVTYNKAEQLAEAVKSIPLSSLILETDGPFLTPEPYRGKRNEPAYVLYTAQKVAEIKKVSLEKVAEHTTKNVCDLFSL